MTTLKILGKTVLGIVAGVIIQWLSMAIILVFGLRIFNSAPVAHFSGGSYTSVGLIASIICIVFFSWRKNWPFVVGILIGCFIWLPLFGIMLVSRGGAV
jgi:hypothetical protein